MSGSAVTAGPDVAGAALVVVQRWRVVAWAGAVAAVIGVVHALVARPEYVATAAFTVADTRTSTGLGLGALAGQLGGGLAALTGPSSAQFMRTALTSRDVVDRLLTRPIHLVPDTASAGRASVGGDSLDLIGWFRVTGKEHARALEDARKRLRESISTSVGDRTGIVNLEVRDRDPRVAASIATGLLDALNRFNLETRQTSSRANRMFLEQRVRDAQRDLQAAEDQMRTFLSHNRVASAPDLLYEQQRLQRLINVRQQVYLALTQDLEQARIDEVKDTPVLTVIEAPVPPARRDWPRRKVLVLAWVLAGLVSGVGLSFLLHWVSEMDRRGAPAWRELRLRLSRSALRRS